MSEDSHEKTLEELKSFVLETKLLLEKVVKMRVECKEAQMNLLRLFNPECIKILDISNELICKNATETDKNNRIAWIKAKENHKAYFE